MAPHDQKEIIPYMKFEDVANERGGLGDLYKTTDTNNVKDLLEYFGMDPKYLWYFMGRSAIYPDSFGVKYRRELDLASSRCRLVYQRKLEKLVKNGIWFAYIPAMELANVGYLSGFVNKVFKICHE